MQPWWRGAVLYQIYPRSFADSNGDGIGDLPGITARLDYVASLGVDGIWLSPIFTSPMADFGYDVADYRGIDPLFGTLDDFRTLLARAHALGLRVVLDQVYSHSSDRHPWFEASRQNRTNAKADWYVWADPKPDGTPPNNWLASFGGAAWSWEPRRRQYYLHNFLASQPDLNVHNPAVQDELLEIARFWLDLGVDGFRLDVANFYTHDRALRDNPPRPGHSGAQTIGYQQRIHNISQPETLRFHARLRAMLDRYEARMAVAEITCENQLERVIEYTAGATLLHTAYSFALLGRALDANAIRATISRVLDAPGEPWPSWALSNHDVPRVASRWAEPCEPPAPRSPGAAGHAADAARHDLPLSGRGTRPPAGRGVARPPARSRSHHQLPARPGARRRSHPDAVGRLAPGRLHDRRALASDRRQAPHPGRRAAAACA